MYPQNIFMLLCKKQKKFHYHYVLNLHFYDLYGFLFFPGPVRSDHLPGG